MPSIRMLTAAAAAVLLSASPVVAQSDAPAPTDAGVNEGVVEVIAVEYAFQGLPGAVPAGTSLAFHNEGAEVHELLVYRINDGVAATLEEMLSMPKTEAEALVEMVGEGPLVAVPGMPAVGTLPLERAGRYVVICYIPQGLNTEVLASLPEDAGLDDLPAELQAAPAHVELGMVQELLVTPTGEPPTPSTPGEDAS